jgi:hypothetical protein
MLYSFLFKNIFVLQNKCPLNGAFIFGFFIDGCSFVFKTVDN